MTAQDNVTAAIEAIQRVFFEVSVPKSTTHANLQNLIKEIRAMLASLE